ncbi:MAG: hypothetical protein JWR38_4864 [Mucilaginibacter sp.]|nr:hypothetical protein [Mucilaginibacter sp.]
MEGSVIGALDTLSRLGVMKNAISGVTGKIMLVLSPTLAKKRKPGHVRFLPWGRGGRGFLNIAKLYYLHKPLPAFALNPLHPSQCRELKKCPALAQVLCCEIVRKG